VLSKPPRPNQVPCGLVLFLAALKAPPDSPNAVASPRSRLSLISSLSARTAGPEGKIAQGNEEFAGNLRSSDYIWSKGIAAPED